MKREPLAALAVTPKRMIIILFCGVVFLFWAAQYAYMPTFPVYIERRGVPLTLVGVILASYGLVQFLLRIPLGLASDRWGRRKPFVLVGLLASAASCLILAWAPRPAWLLVGRTLSGVAASTWVTSSVLFASYFPQDRTGRAVSIVNFVFVFAQVVVSLIGGRLADIGGWLAPFYLGAMAGLLGAVLLVGVPDETVTLQEPSTRETLRRVGSRPLLLVASAMAGVGVYLNHALTYGFVPVYAANVHGASRTALGWLMMLTQLACAGAMFGSASLAERITPQRVLILGMLITGLSVMAVPLAPSLMFLTFVRLWFGLGYGLVYSVSMGLSITGVPNEERALAMGIFQALYAIGMFIGPALTGMLADWVGLARMFWLTSLLPFAAAGVMAWLRRLPRKDLAPGT